MKFHKRVARDTPAKTLTCVWANCLLAFLLTLIFAVPGFSTEKGFVIGTSYKVLFSNEEQSGMLDLLVKETFKRIDIDVDVPFIPAERSMTAANRGYHDGVLNRIEGLETTYSNLIRVPESNMDFKFVAFSKKHDFPTNDWSTLYPLRIGFIKGWKILERNLKSHPDITYANSAEQLFRLLDKGRIDIAIYGELVGYAQLHTMNMKDIKVLQPPLATRKMYMYLNKKHKNIVPKAAKALREMKADGTYDEIVNKTVAPFLEN